MQRSIQIQRILKEQKDFETNRSDTMFAAPLEGQMHIWHFTIRGPPDTEFQDGIYHGKIELPVDYPLKAPSIYFITPSGRYETNTPICLTITSYHPEAWNPAWTIRSMLQAIVSYFPEKEKVAGVGALSYSVEDRKKIAAQSRKFKCPQCGPITNLLPGDEKALPEKESNAEGSRKGSEMLEQQQKDLSNSQAERNRSGNDQFDFEALSSDQKELLMKNDFNELAEENKGERYRSHADREERGRAEHLKYRESQVDIEEEEKRDAKFPRQAVELTERKRRTNGRLQKQNEENDVPPLIEYILRQHELYYEAKSSIIFRPNILNTSAQKQPTPTTPLLRNQSSRTEDITTEKLPTLQPQNSTLSENLVEASTTINQPDEQSATAPEISNTAQNNTVPHESVRSGLNEEQLAERQHIQKKIKLIDLLIIVVVVLLIGYSVFIRL